MNYLTNHIGEPVGPRLGLPVLQMLGKQPSARTETLSYNGPAASGGLTINSVAGPILAPYGGRVGSYWGLPENLVYTTKNIDSLTETALSAAIVITDPSLDLEAAFETADSSVKRFVLKVTDNSGNSLYGWIGGVSESGSQYTFSIYNSRLSVSAQSWVGTLANFDVTRGARAEIFRYASSLSFLTGTSLTEEVCHPREHSAKNMIRWAAENLTAGEFFADYLTGEIIGKRADNTASELVTFLSPTAPKAPFSYKNLDVDESEDQVCAHPARVVWIHAMNMSASVRYLKLYNATAASVTVGTTVPDHTFPLPTLGDTNGAGFTLYLGDGIPFSTALTVACTTGLADNDAGAPGAGEVILNLGYA